MTQMTYTLTHTVYAAYPEMSLAERAAGALIDHGVRTSDISIVSTDAQAEYTRGDSDFTAEGAPAMYSEEPPAHEDPWYAPSAIPEYPDAHGPSLLSISTTTGKDAAVGAAKGASLGLGVGALAALASLAIPGVGVIMGGGALAAAIAGAAGATAAGAVAGAIHGFLVDQGVPGEAAERYVDAYRAGDTIVAVSVPSNGVDEWEVDGILSKYHGTHINSYRSE